MIDAHENCTSMWMQVVNSGNGNTTAFFGVPSGLLLGSPSGGAALNIHLLY